MEIELLKLYNTLATIETKGENTKIMADCLRYMEQLIAKVKANQSSETTQDTENNG